MNLFPLSYQQQRIYFVSKLYPTSLIWNYGCYKRLAGNVDVHYFSQAIKLLIHRHPILRSVFVEDSEGICHSAINDSPLSAYFKYYPMDELNGNLNQTEEEMSRIISTTINDNFSLSEGPLFRCSLLQVDAECIIVLGMHHIICDYSSWNILWEDIDFLYNKLRSGKNNTAISLPPTYSDYALEQQIHPQEVEEDLSYWIMRYQTPVPALNIPTDYQRPRLPSMNGAFESHTIDKQLVSDMNRYCLHHRITQHALLFSAFYLLLSIYSNEQDLAIGIHYMKKQCFGRDFRKTLGNFVNTLPVRISCEPNISIHTLTQQIHSLLTEAYHHQDCPFERIVREINPTRDLSRHPVYQAEFNYVTDIDKNGMGDLFCGLQPLQNRILSSEAVTSEVDISLFVSSVSSGLTSKELELSFSYARELFHPQKISQMANGYLHLIKQLISGEVTQISELCLLTPDERDHALVQWNSTQLPCPAHCIHQLIEAQTRKTPDATAVVFEDQELTYKELNEQANKLARHLKSLGVGSETLVGICVERSLEMIIGLIGILKAGGACVPLDPSYPKERLAFMLEDTAVTIILTRQRSMNRLPEHKAKLVCLDSDWELLNNEDASDLACDVCDDNLAYIIYTSGSTGQPKGVMIEHRNTVGLLYWARCEFTNDELTGVLAGTSICFDLSVFEIFAPLCWGGTVILVRDVLQLTELCDTDRITLINTVPSAMAELIKQNKIPSSVKSINLAGEMLSQQLVEKLCLIPQINRVRDLYGPSETTTYSACGLRCPGEEANIGRPIANTQIYILDKYLNPVSIGVIGEIYIGGQGVARGYLNRPELTKERFIPDPFSDCPDSRLYRTGDLARYFSDGKIQLLGRIDNQVKIRGFRIELGEIESVLSIHPDVQECAVVTGEEISGNKKLVAYILAAQSSQPETSGLRAFLRDKLPDYMIPSNFVMLESMPLTSNGKVDRKSLPAPDKSRSELTQADIVPKTASEEIIAGIWSYILGTEQVGINDNFFEMGGHSLLATRVVSRVSEVFQVEVPIRILFEYPTIARFAEQIDEIKKAGEGLQTPALLPVSRDGHLPLSFSEQRLWFLDQLNPGSTAYNMPFVYRLIGDLNEEALRLSLEVLIRRHEILRTRYRDIDGIPTRIIDPPEFLVLFPVDVHHLDKEARAREIERLLVSEARFVNDLSEGPLLRCRLLREDTDRHIFVLVLHHIIFDGWSLDILIRELVTLYEDFASGRRPSLPDIKLQYADFAVWQRNYLQGKVQDDHLSYWKKQLADLPNLELPTDRPRPHTLQHYEAAGFSFIINSDLTRSLKAVGAAEGCTLFMTLSAGLSILLSRYSNEKIIAIGTPIANRNLGEVEHMIGFFVNTLVLKTDLSDSPTFRQLLARVRETTLQAYAHREMPFEKLVEELQPQRDLGRHPLFQVLLNVLNTPSHPLEMKGIMVESLAIPTKAESKFDLTFYVSETDDCIQMHVSYNSFLFSSERISAMTKHFETLLRNAVENPEKNVSDLQMLSQDELPQPLVPHVTRKASGSTTLIERFAEQVSKHSTKIALRAHDQEWSYGKLDAAAHSVACAMASACATPDKRVALLFEDDFLAIAAMLGILKSGAAFVPLDPAYPLERLRYQVRDARVCAIITDRPSYPLAEKLSVDTPVIMEAETLVTKPGPNIDLPSVSPDALAYILYTSGSTGLPKGVMQNHENVIHFAEAFSNGIDIVSDDVTTMLSSYTFDAAIVDIFGTLLNGATLCPISVKRAPSEHVLNILNKNKVSVYHSTPTTFRYLMENCRAEDMSHIRVVVLGGEEVRPSDVELYARFFGPQCKLMNLYGSSESSVSLIHSIEQGQWLHQEFIPIGRPVKDTDLVLLDKQGCKTDICGEIAISSIHLTPGYWRNEELTNRTFSQAPEISIGRLYRTGDLGRLEPNGVITFLGRKDSQIKIRGFRVEMEEIATALQEHDSVRECAVVASDEPDRRLYAFVTCSNPTSTLSLRSPLRDILPDFMIPSAIINIDHIPRTPNGKIDRRKLITLMGTERLTRTTSDAPATQLEKNIADIWQSVLKTDTVTPTDTFFDLGGHSLLAIKAMSMISKTLGYQIPLRDFFTQTLRQIAANCQENSVSNS